MYPLRLILIFWYVNYIFGMIFLNNKIVIDPKYNVYNSEAEVFYFLCLISTSLGIYFYRPAINLSKLNYNGPIENIPIVTYYLFLVYPFVFLVETYFNLGFLPILLSGSINEDMYDYKFGYLSGYKALFFYSIIMLFFEIFVSKKLVIINLILIIVFFAISLIDGRRTVLLFTLMGVLFFLFKYVKNNLVNIFSILVPLIASIVYVSLIFFRSGTLSEFNFSDLISNFPLGVEFSDYVYSFNNIKIIELNNFSLIKASIGSFFNSSFLSLLGYSKSELISHGSEYVWMDIFNSNLGIRTGIVSELYFSFGYSSVFIFFVIGMMFKKVCKHLLESKNLFISISYIYILTLISFLIVGQISVFWGFIIVIIYISVLNFFIKLFAI